MRRKAEKDRASRDKNTSKSKSRQYSGWVALVSKEDRWLHGHLPLLSGDTSTCLDDIWLLKRKVTKTE